jgi:hypothetical protein
VIAALNRPSRTSREVLAEYRIQIFGRGEHRGSDDPKLRIKVRRGFARKAVERVMKEGGKLNRWEMLRCRMRYFADGAVLGSKEFVDAVFDAERDRFGPNRKDGARRMRFVEAGSLRVLRDLRVVPVG